MYCVVCELSVQACALRRYLRGLCLLAGSRATQRRFARPCPPLPRPLAPPACQLPRKGCPHLPTRQSAQAYQLSFLLLSLSAGQLPGKVRTTLMLDGAMRDLAGELKGATSLLFFGRGYNYATALEAALKVR